MSEFFHSAIYQPIYNLLIWLYDILPGHDFGLAIIVLTLLLRFALYPVSQKQLEAQKKMTDLQPQIKELQEKHKHDKETQTREIMDFYKKKKANPFGGCLPMVVQIVFFIAIYRTIANISDAGLKADGEVLYRFVKDPGQIKSLFLGIVDLTKPNYILAGLAAIAQFFQTKLMMAKKNDAEIKKEGKEKDIAQIMNKQMLFLGPFMTLMIGVKFASGLSIYWLTSTLFGIFQQLRVNKKAKQ